MNIIEELIKHETEVKEWLIKNYSQEKIDNEIYDDTGYPHWNEVESTFEKAFNEIEFEKLTENELKSVAYLLDLFNREYQLFNVN